jgi:hypothetical protein
MKSNIKETLNFGAKRATCLFAEQFNEVKMEEGNIWVWKNTFF